MVLILGILQFVLAIWILLYEYRKKSPAMLLWATLFIMFSFPHLINCYQGKFYKFDYLVGTMNFSSDVLNSVSIFVILFTLIYIATRLLTNKSDLSTVLAPYGVLRKDVKRETKSGSALLLASVYFIGTLLWFIPFVQNVGGILASSWSLANRSSDYANMGQVSGVLLYSCAFLALYQFYKKKYISSFLIAAVNLLIVIVTRSRIQLLPILCGIVFVVLSKNPRITVKTFVKYVLVGIFLIYVIYGWRVYRFYGSIENFLEQFDLQEFIGQINTQIVSGDGEMGLYRYFYYFVAHDNNFEDFGRMHTYLRMLLIFIPTQLSFGLKPSDFAIAMGQAVNMSDIGSMHPTLFGDCFANAGFYGVFLGIFWALYVSVTDRLISTRKSILFSMLFYGMNASMYCIIARGSVYNGFFHVAYGTVFLLLCEWITIHVKSKKITIRFAKHSISF